MEKKFIFADEQLNSALFLQTQVRLTEAADRFDSAVATMAEDGLPTSKAWLKEHMGELAIKNYLNDKIEEEVKAQGGYLCDPDVKQNIIARYSEVYQRIDIAVEAIRQTFTKPILPIIEKNGRAALDRTKIDEIAKLNAKFFIDGRGLSEYYELISDIKKAMDRASDFETAHGMPHFSDGHTTITFGDMFGNQLVPQEITLDRYFRQPDKHRFLTIFNQYFKK